jgi:hypothetical protein
MVERAFELGNERPQRTVVLAQKFELILGFGGLGKRGVAAQPGGSTFYVRTLSSQLGKAYFDSMRYVGPAQTPS